MSWIEVTVSVFIFGMWARSIALCRFRMVCVVVRGSAIDKSAFVIFCCNCYCSVLVGSFFPFIFQAFNEFVGGVALMGEYYSGCFCFFFVFGGLVVVCVYFRRSIASLL